MIRNAEAPDCPALTAIVRGSSAYAGHYRAMVEDLSVTEADLAVNVVRVYEESGAPRGFFSLIWRDGEGDLDLMFVANGNTGKGIGRALFADMLQAARARGYGRVRIVSHPPAAGFYEHMGARRAGTEPPAGRVTWARPIFEVALD